MINFIDSIGDILPKKLNPDTYLPFRIPGLGIIYTLILALITGLLVRNYVGKKALGYWEMIVDKIPLVRVVYSALRQVAQAILVKGDTQFKKVALIEYPRRGIYSLGFITGRACHKLSVNTHSQMIGVFVPTTPNPTSGFYLMVPEEDIVNVDISVEDAFKLILSGGMVHPNSTPSNITSQSEPRVK
ncbi:MAG: DUF502 domain-containing protein [Thermodesulfobacteriota bacterium]|nr:DUF502 domain-containing protein [Thermodesulfobacteriota bacterium]